MRQVRVFAPGCKIESDTHTHVDRVASSLTSIVFKSAIVISLSSALYLDFVGKFRELAICGPCIDDQHVNLEALQGSQIASSHRVSRT